MSYAEEDALAATWPDWDRRSRPPQFDWFIALELALDLQVDIFRLHGLPLGEPFTSLAQQWAGWRRHAWTLVDQMHAAKAAATG